VSESSGQDQHIAIALSIAAVAVVLYGVTAMRNSKEVTWNSFDAGMQQASSQNKKVLIDVYTDWCTWCKKMDSDVYSDASVADYLKKNFVTIRLNAESNESVHYKGQSYTASGLAQAFGVNGYPTTIFLKEDGNPITSLPGYVDAGRFSHILSYIAENRYLNTKFEDYLKEKGN
jgi:thioredoxin-related protein